MKKDRVLLIEDDVIVRENTAEILQFADYEVITASNGKDGVVKAKKEIPDIIICDIMMPKLDGYGVFQLVSTNERLKDVPFIFLTAKANYADIRKGMNLGADDFITKPFEESELLSAISARLKKVRAYKKNENTCETGMVLNNTKNVNIHSFVREFCKRKDYLFKKGENIFCEGNKSNHIFLVKKGIVKTYKTTKEGKELITGIFKENRFLGVTSCLGEFPHTENAEAMEDSRIIKINKLEVISIVKSNPSIAYEMIQLFASSIKTSKEKMVQIAYDSVRGRTAKSLLLLTINDTQNKINLSRSNLASLTGIAKETLIRTLSDFKDEGLIETGRTFVKIIDKENLSRVN
jgi:CheY-like chemotaxis protein/CRP-like cAMP-binding protein